MVCYCRGRGRVTFLLINRRLVFFKVGMIGHRILVVQPHGIFCGEESENCGGNTEAVTDTIAVYANHDGDRCGKNQQAKFP